jgi:two-component system nitrate/nitrite response regulator NarL
LGAGSSVVWSIRGPARWGDLDSARVQPGERITVYVADDHPVFREAVGRAIKSRPDFELIGQAADGREALTEIRELTPSVALLDNGLPSLTGVDILRAVKRDAVPTRVIILSADVTTLRWQ